MNCGIEVLKRLNELLDQDLKEVIDNCEQKVDEHGLNMLVMFEELNQVLPCQAVASLHLIKNTPYIAFIGFDHKGHYVLVEDIQKKVKLFDPAKGYLTMTKLHFYMIWSKKAIIFML